MLLQALYKYAEKNNLMDGEAFEEQNVRWVIPIDRDGNLRGNGLIDLATKENKKGKLFPCPKTSKSKNVGGVSEYLVDGITSVFGMESDPLKAEKNSEKNRLLRIENNTSKCNNFWEQVKSAYEDTDSYLLKSILLWQKNVISDEGFMTPCFVRFGVSLTPRENEKPKYWISIGEGSERPLGAGERFIFEVDSKIVLDSEPLVNYWKECFRREKEGSEESSERGLCLITGKTDVPIQKSHSVIKVPGGLSTGSYLISFSASKESDICSFVSYGKVKGQNAPVSIHAASAYILALGKLLSDERHNVRVGNQKTCFWTKENDGFSGWIAEMIDKPEPENVKNFLEKWRSGSSSYGVEHDRFYAVTLTGNAGRVIVKQWIDQPLYKAAENIKQWFEDLSLTYIPHENKKNGEDFSHLSIFRLSCATVRDAKDLQKGVFVQLLRAALEGVAPSLMLLKPILYRFKCDMAKGNYAFNSSRFSFLKLILLRNRKENGFMPEKELCDTDDIPYNLGRLLSVLDRVQAAAHDYNLKGAGVVERYYGTASSSPALVFPLLLRLVRHHKKKIETTKSAAWVDSVISDILSKIHPVHEGSVPSFPRNLTLEQQGRFAIGFYQQKAHDRLKSKEIKKLKSK